MTLTVISWEAILKAQIWCFLIMASTFSSNGPLSSTDQSTQAFHTTQNLSLSQANSHLGLMDYPIVNRDDFFGCFHYDCCNVDMLLLSQCLVSHNDIKSPFLVFVLKLMTSFRNTQCMMNTHHTYMMDSHHMMDTHHKLLAIRWTRHASYDGHAS